MGADPAQHKSAVTMAGEGTLGPPRPDLPRGVVMAGSGTLMLNVPGVKLPPLGADGSAVSILNVKIIATGVVDPPTASLIEQMQDYYDSLSPMDLMLILATCWQCLFATLQDPETGMYTTLFLLPTMALVLRALRKQR